MTTFQRTLLAAAAAMSLATGAHASASAILYTAGATGEMSSPGSVSASFNAAAGAGNVALEIQGFSSLDGDNFYVDIFHLTVNGSDVFSGTWDLGGGGLDHVLNGPAGATVNHVGQTVDLSIPVTFLNGANSVVFSYDSPTSFEGTGRQGPQGLGDEGWGLDGVTATGMPFAAAVPEPETYALMLGGLAGLGFMSRRRAARR